VVRRRVVATLAGVMLVAAGCGGDDAPTASAEGEGCERAELSYALWNQDQAPVMEELVAAFQEDNPDVDVSVEVTPFTEYFTKLQTAITGGEGPDVFWLNAPNTALYASNEAILPLSDFIEQDEVDMSVYPEALLELYTRDDEVFALPRDFDTIGLWYNKALFDAAGVEYPTDDWTWEDLQAAAKELTDPAAGVYGIAAWLTDQQGYYNTIAQAGGAVVSSDGTESGYDDEQTIEGLRFWTDLIEEGASPTHQQMVDTEPKQMFQSGKVAMFYGGSWQAVSLSTTPALQDNLDVAPLPAGEEDTSIIHGLGNAINANTECPQEAWELVKFLSSEEAAETMAASGIVIPAYEGTQDGWLEAFPNLNLQAFLDQVEQATPFPVTENTAEWQALEKEMLPAAWTGERPVEEVAGDLATAMDEVLGQND
jgi:multiple sugar transport system substrate-binding protein